MYKQVLEYLELKRKAMKVVSEIREQEIIYVEEHRKFQPGDKVEIWNGIKDKFHAEGIIGGCRNFALLFIGDELTHMMELDTGEKYEKCRNDFYYEVFAVRKDGTQSSKHLFSFPHYIQIDTEAREFENYVIKIKK